MARSGGGCGAGGSGLGVFGDWAGGQLGNEADVLETVVPESDDDAVRLLTVHGSKGLEFPITIVAGLASTGRRAPNLVWDVSGQPQIRLKADALETHGFAAANKLDAKESELESTRLLYVALTRAMDYLVLGCYHSRPKQSPAQKVWKLLSPSGLAVSDAMSADDMDLASVESLLSDNGGAPMSSLPGRVEFAAARGALLEEVGARVATSPTALVKAAQGASVKAAPSAAVIEEAETKDSVFEEEALEPLADGEAAADDMATVGETRPHKYPRRGSSKGAAIGSAVHRVLELVDLANPTAEEIIRLAELACAESEIPALVKDVASRARTALRADVVHQAGQSGRAWREVCVIVRDGDRYVEGYIDLLAEASSGRLVVVDYKTDRVDSAEDIAEKEAHYAPQLAQYQSAVRAVVGADDVATQLVFASPDPGTARR